MKFLLDTHTLLWFFYEPEKLPKKILDFYDDPKNEIFVSVISLWEISIKYQLGKLKFERFHPDMILAEMQENELELLEISPDLIASFHKLPLKHKDPFDRMMIWQCLNHKLTMLSKDKQMDLYKKEGLKRIW